MTLYDLTADFEKFTDMLDRQDVDDEMKSAISEALENLKDDIEDKIDNYGKGIKNRQASIKARNEEIARLQALNDSDNKAIERMKEIVELAMKATGNPKIKTSMFTFWVQKNPESVVVDEAYIENIPEEFLVYPEPKINKAAIKEALKGDDEALKERLEGIAHIKQTESIRLK